MIQPRTHPPQASVSKVRRESARSPGDHAFWIALVCLVAVWVMLLAKPPDGAAGHGPMWYGLMLISIAGAAITLPAGLVLGFQTRGKTSR